MSKREKCVLPSMPEYTSFSLGPGRTPEFSQSVIKKDRPIFVWVMLGLFDFFAYPLRSLNEILDRSKATSARPAPFPTVLDAGRRPRKLSLPDYVGTGRPQTPCTRAEHS